MTSDAYDDRFTTRAADERRHYSSFVFIVRIAAVLSRGSIKVIRERDRLHMPLRSAGRTGGWDRTIRISSEGMFCISAKCCTCQLLGLQKISNFVHIARITAMLVHDSHRF